MKRDNNQLYEHIMRNVSREVKKTLNEAGYVGQRVKKDKIYSKYLVFYIIGFDISPYMHKYGGGCDSLDEIIEYAYALIDDDDHIEYYERDSYKQEILEFLNTNVPKLRVGQFAQFEIRKYVNFIVLKMK